MTIDSTSSAAPFDVIQAATVSASDSSASALSRLQADAGLHGEVEAKAIQSLPGAFAGSKFGWGAAAGSFYTHVGDSVPTDQERSDAEKALENRMSKLIPETDRASMIAMTNAITKGDAKAFAEAVKQAGGDPKKLKELVAEVDKMLEERNCSTRLDVTADGKVLVSDTGRGTALQFDPASGKIEAKEIEHNADGSLLIKPGEVLHADTDKDFKDMSDRAVNGVNGRTDFTIEPDYRIMDHEKAVWPGINFAPGLIQHTTIPQ